MKGALASLTRAGALAVTLLVPSLASARAVEDVTLSADPADIVLTVASDAALHAPTIRTYPGVVRIRFYDAHETPALRLVGDGGAVRSVDVGSGSDLSAALVLMLGDRTRLAPADVRVERDEHKVVIKIARGLLPAVREGSPMQTAKQVLPKPVAPVAAVVKAPVAKPAAPPAPQVASAVPTPPAAVAATPAVAPVAAAPAAAPVAAPVALTQAELPPAEPAPPAVKPAPLTALGVKKAPAAVAPKSELKLASGSNSAMPVLLTISALLALAYGVMRLMMRKNGVVQIPAIDIVAQKRLGARHQLVIVRAFERDYLLSIQGGQTTVVARSTRKRPDGTEHRLDASEEMLSPVVRRRAPAPLSRELEEDDEVTFGGELFKSALDQRERQRDQTAGFRLEAARADARAELARLDAAREEFAPPAASAPAPAPAAIPSARPVMEPDSALAAFEREEERRAAEAVPNGMSDSVSGLLRLRKASGR